MITKKDFYCQFDSYNNERLAKALCGVTAISMVLSAKGVFTDFTEKSRKLDKFFTYINSLQKNNVPSVKRRFKLKDRDVLVTLGFFGQVNKTDEDIVETDSELFPVFVLYRGYDHRASSVIFKYFGLEAYVQQGVSGKELFNMLHTGTCTYFLASIVSKYKDKDATIAPTHVILIQRAILDENGICSLEYVDPAERSYDRAINTISVPDFEKIFNKFGTFIK